MSKTRSGALAEGIQSKWGGGAEGLWQLEFIIWLFWSPTAYDDSRNCFHLS